MKKITGIVYTILIITLLSCVSREETPAINEDILQHSDMDEKDALELSKEMQIGWNLGNSLDAPEGETTWGNPKTSEAFIEQVSQAGFKTIRIPVTWSMHMGEAPRYTIDNNWMNRVEEVVGYALRQDLYVIINLHHDGADNYEGVEWLKLNDASGAVTESNNKAVEEQFSALWTQLAKRFKGYDEHLIFESMNEIHDGYGNPKPQYFEIINNLNQVFVDIVRRSGGNNASRHLLIPGYNTNIDHTLKGFEFPRDSVENRLMLSVHYYDPWTFALSAQTHRWGKGTPDADNWGQEEYVQSQFRRLKENYVDKGVPVIIGEYGATNQAGYEDYRRYYMEYVTKAAYDNGLVPVVWDNGGLGSGGECFGLFDRNSRSVKYPQIMDAIMTAVNSDYSLDDIIKPVE